GQPQGQREQQEAGQPEQPQCGQEDHEHREAGRGVDEYLAHGAQATPPGRRPGRAAQCQSGASTTTTPRTDVGSPGYRGSTRAMPLNCAASASAACCSVALPGV